MPNSNPAQPAKQVTSTATSALSISTVDSLTALAHRINAEHAQAETALRDGLRHAVEAGRLLLEARAAVAHGEWLLWLESNFDGSARTARAYMLVAARLPRLEKHNGSAVANLSFRQALRLTAAPKATKEPATDQGEGKRFLDAPLDVRQKTCREWWDILALHTVVLDAAGWEPAKIAEATGVEKREVDAILNPRPAQYDFQHYRDPGTMARRYADAVAEELANSLRWIYFSAPYSAEREGFPEIIPALKAMEGKQQRLHASLDGSLDDLIRGVDADARTKKEKRVWPIAMRCCISDDVRESLGVAPHSFPSKFFLLHFVKWCRVVEENCKQEGRDDE